MLAACSANESLPTSPDLPADVFTACLTTPILIALRWFANQTIINGVTAEQIDKIPGRPNDRRTAMGELNWIFTAITDTIAWNVLSPKLFQKLFREDLLVASLFRNYLLAERILRSCKCTPQSHPKLPATYNHPMWQAWDLEADHCLSQLTDLVTDPNYEYKHSSFFTEQLTAFEVWLEFGTESKKPPEQLPIVLQVLLSQQHRQRALELLAQFLDLGMWAVNNALSVGIFPYVLKLLQSPAVELRQVLVFIWTKILVLDKSCQFDLVKDNSQHYFISVLASPTVPIQQRVQCAFILSMICNNCRPGQSACLTAKLLKICLSNLNNTDSLLRRWVVLVLAKLWENNETAKREAITESAHIQLCGLLTDPVPEVRAAAVYALGTFISRAPSLPNREPRTIIELNLGLTFAVVASDASILVRKELIVALAALVNAYEPKFRATEVNLMKLDLAKRLGPSNSDLLKKLNSSGTGKSPSSDKSDSSPAVRKILHDEVKKPGLIPDGKDQDEQPEEEDEAIYDYLWKGVLSLMNDPYPPFAHMTRKLVAKIKADAKNDIQQLGIRLPPETRGKVEPQKKPPGSFEFFQPLRKPAPLPPVATPSPSPVVTTELELKSTIYEWSCQYFGTQLFRTNHEDDQNSPKHCEKRWALQRNLDSMKDSIAFCEGAHGTKSDHSAIENVFDMQPEKRVRTIQTLDNEIAILENNNQLVSRLCFHPFEDTVFVADEHDGITIWNWKEGVEANHFVNNNPAGTRISSLGLLNEHESTLLCVGSDDGVLKIWSLSNPREETSTKLLTAWHVLDDLVPVRGLAAGMVLEWQKKRDMLIASGNVDILKIWDLNKELAIQDLPTEASSCVTCLTSDQLEAGGNTIVAGFADSSLRIFDRRNPNKYSLVHLLNDNKGWIVNTFMPHSLNHQVITCSSHGEVKIWDLRQTKKATKTIAAHNNPTVFAFTAHEYAPLFAIGTQDQRIRVMDYSGEEISLIRYHDGFLGQRIGPISALTFHPFKVMLAAGATDSIVSIYTGDRGSTN